MSSDIKKYAVIGSVLLTIILLSSCTGKNDDIKVVKPEIKVIEKQEVINDNNIEKEKIEETSIVKSEGLYSKYSEKLLANSKGNIVLFFAASWCPSCKTADKNLSSETIPEGLTVLKLDYDSNLELRKKYKVTSQHAFVLVDNKGNEIDKWYGSRNVNDILKKIK